MDGLEWNALLKWLIWGYHYFRKHPYGELRFYNVGNIGASAEPMFARRFVTGLKH